MTLKPSQPTNSPRWGRVLLKVSVIVMLVAGLYLVLNFSQFLGGQFESPHPGQPLSLALLFIAGTLTSFHCAGMCGALVVGYTVKHAAEGRARWMSHVYYAVGKTLSYTLIGGLFGALGAIVTFSPQMRGVAGLAAGVFLILFGLSTLRVFGSLPQVRLRLPAFVSRWMGGVLRRSPHPFVIGLLNGLMIICGPLQAMYVMAAGTGSPLEGAKMLFVFGLGTLPLMMGFGFLASALSSQFAPRLVRASGLIVVLLGIIMLQRGSLMLEEGSDPHAAMHGEHAGPVANQAVHTRIDRPGAVDDRPVVETGRPVSWMLMGTAIAHCGASVSIPALRLTFPLQTGMTTVQFTPVTPGLLAWRCEQGGIQGEFDVRDAEPFKVEFPMAGKIRELIEKSASALEALRRQLRP